MCNFNIQKTNKKSLIALFSFISPEGVHRATLIMLKRLLIIVAITHCSKCFWDTDFEPHLVLDEKGRMREVKQSKTKLVPNHPDHKQSASDLAKTGFETPMVMKQDDMYVVRQPLGKRSGTRDVFKLSLSHKYQLAKVINLRYEDQLNQTVLHLTTYMTNKEKYDYPFRPTKSPDSVYLNKKHSSD